MTRLLVATRNEGKLRELRELLAGSTIELVTLAEYAEVTEVEETGETFEANARLKAEHAARSTGLWALGEDSGLEVDALGGAPGVRSARYAGAHGDDEANNRKLLEALNGKPERSARYVCAIALAEPGGDVVHVVRGTCEGDILPVPRGGGGFGYDPIFLPRGQIRTMAEITQDEKGKLSHRGEAVRRIAPELTRRLEAR